MTHERLTSKPGLCCDRYPSPRHRSARHRPSRSAPPRWARSACGGKARGRGGGRRAKFQGHRTPRPVVPSTSRLLAGDAESGKRAGPLQGLELLVSAPGRIKAPKPCRWLGQTSRRPSSRGEGHQLRGVRDSDARPIPSGAGRRAGRSGGGSEWVSAQGALRPGSPGTNLSTGCSEFRPQPAATGGPIPGSSQLRAGTHRSARTGEEARHPLLMEWAGAESHLVCTPLLSAPGGEGVEGRTPNHCDFLAGQKRKNEWTVPGSEVTCTSKCSSTTRVGLL